MDTIIITERLTEILSVTESLRDNILLLKDIKLHLINIHGLLYYLVVIGLFIIIWILLNIVFRSFIR